VMVEAKFRRLDMRKLHPYVKHEDQAAGVHRSGPR
jgi:hypothetical protein